MIEDDSNKSSLDHCKYCGNKINQDQIDKIFEGQEAIICELCGAKLKKKHLEATQHINTELPLGKLARQMRIFTFRRIYEILNTPEFIEKIHNLGVEIKLDTNGTFPEMLNRVIDMGLVNYVAMDIKGPLNFNGYEKSARIKSKELFEKVRRSVDLIIHSGIDYEFRTTVVPALHSMEDILEIAREIEGTKKYALQNFSNRETMDPEFQKIAPYKIEELEKICELCLQYVQCCVVRGK